MSKPCSIDGCDRPTAARGWCIAHWNRWKRHGDPLGSAPKPSPLYEHPGAQPGLCAVPGCGRKLRARGVCVTHYQRWRDTGSVAPEVAIVGDLDDDTRFWANVDKRDPDDCWHWTGPIDRGGYGRFSTGRGGLAHRWSYKRFNGPVGNDQSVDHVCHNRDKTCRRGPTCPHRRCVNPAHLDAVEPRENTYRAFGTTATTCSAGHPKTDENAAWNTVTGVWQCKECHRIRSRQRYARKKAAISAQAR